VSLRFLSKVADPEWEGEAPAEPKSWPEYVQLGRSVALPLRILAWGVNA
jgi:hypothetical protein